MTSIPIPETPEDLDSILETVPDRPAVFLLWANEGKPYLARTGVLRKRLKRLLGAAGRPSRLLNLRRTAARAEYRLTGSKLDAQFCLWELAQEYLGEDYRAAIRLRLPSYVKLVLSNQFPRTCVTSRIGRPPAVYFGPFRNRSTASLFDAEFLDLFQLRRCQDDLHPSPEHPGCMYGEMGRCLRPCQIAVGPEEYRGETDRVAEFLRSGGQSLIESATAARESLSNAMDFEGAAVIHQRIRKIEEVLSLRDEMARNVEHLHAITITRSAQEGAVELGWLRGGVWRGFQELTFTAASLDARLREMAANIPATPAAPMLRMEQLAILSRWFYSSWRDGEMLLVDDWEKIPYRKLVNAVSRVAKS